MAAKVTHFKLCFGLKQSWFSILLVLVGGLAGNLEISSTSVPVSL